MLTHPDCAGLAPIGLDPEGVGAPKSANLWLPYPLPDTAGASRRATCGDYAIGGPRFRRQCPASPATDRSQSDVGGLRWDQSVPGQTVVSQLLAGPRSGHGGPRRRPSAWHAKPDRGAPHPVPHPRRLAKRPSNGRGDAESTGGFRGGDKFGGAIKLRGRLTFYRPRWLQFQPVVG
jgi:hypothetical protein